MSLLRIVIALLLMSACTCTPESPRPSLRAIERGRGAGPIVVMLHGYRSRPEELVSFTERTDLPAGSHFVLPYGPEQIEGAFAWFSLPNDLSNLRGRSFPGMGEARARLSALLDEQRERYGERPIVILGFSQGAMLALDFALHDPRPLAGLLLLSSTLVDERACRPLVAQRRGLPVYMSTGETDDILPFSERRALIHMLERGGMNVRVRTFPGGHVVTNEVSTDAAMFIGEVTRGRRRQ